MPPPLLTRENVTMRIVLVIEVARVLAELRAAIER